MKHAGVLCGLAAMAVCGCATASQHVAEDRGPEGLLLTWAMVNLHTRDLAAGPSIAPLPRLFSGPPGVSVAGIVGGCGGYDHQGRRWEGPSYEIGLTPQGEAVHLAVALVEDERTHRAERRVPLKKGESCVVFIPEEAPEFVFILGIDALPVGG